MLHRDRQTSTYIVIGFCGNLLASVSLSVSVPALCWAVWTSHYYSPQRSWGKVMFLQACVILFTGGGVCISACWDTTPLCSRHLPPPGADTPPQSRQPPEQTHTPRAHPLGADTPQQIMLGDTVNAWAVRILLECNLVGQWKCSGQTRKRYHYRSGTVNSKSFIGKVLLRIKRKFELN